MSIPWIFNNTEYTIRKILNLCLSDQRILKWQLVILILWWKIFLVLLPLQVLNWVFHKQLFAKEVSRVIFNIFLPKPCVYKVHNPLNSFQYSQVFRPRLYDKVSYYRCAQMYGQCRLLRQIDINPIWRHWL